VRTATISATLPRPPLRLLGRTGLIVSAIGLGLAALGRPAYMALGRDEDLGTDRSVAAMKQRCHALLDAAHVAGIRYVDVARSYGLAEQFLSTWWNERQLPDTALTVGSKWGYTYTGAWQLDAPVHEVKRLSIDTLRRQSLETRSILGPRLSLYQIHSATIDSHVLEDRDVLTEMVELRQEGVCIGLTVTGPRQADVIWRALEVQADGVGLFQTVQATWNLLEPSAARALADASAEGLGVIVKEVLANGRLTTQHSGPELRQIRDHARTLGTTVETIAVASAVAQPWADVVLSGAVTRRQLEGHLAALDVVPALVPSEPFAEPSEVYWRRRSKLVWS
jgi:aryl-alcohol dehydrogenase-like predicted oxidoreductase